MATKPDPVEFAEFLGAKGVEVEVIRLQSSGITVIRVGMLSARTLLRLAREFVKSREVNHHGIG